MSGLAPGTRTSPAPNRPVSARSNWHRTSPRPTWRAGARYPPERYEDASQEFEESIRLNPNLFDAYYYFARATFAHGDVASSAVLFRRAADVRQEDFQSPFLLAQSLRMLGRDDEASVWRREGIRRAEHALALNPQDGRALSLGALCCSRKARPIARWSGRTARSSCIRTT